jgi:hypothetical protein
MFFHSQDRHGAQVMYSKEEVREPTVVLGECRSFCSTYPHTRENVAATLGWPCANSTALLSVLGTLQKLSSNTRYYQGQDQL